MFDLVIRNATLIDGTGAPGRPGELAVEGDRIVRVGAVREGGRIEVDARGQALAPGFVDVHTHDDGAYLRYPGLEFKLSQGVTTNVIGNCGYLPAPVNDGSREWIQTNAILNLGPVTVEWQDLAGYVAAVEARRPACNAIALLGHHPIRLAAFGNEQRPPTAQELAQMQGWVEQGMEQGACGLSTGLIYEPGRWADTEELIALCRPVAAHGGVYATHMRNEGLGLLDSVEETLRIGREAGCAVHISHHKASGKGAPGLVPQSLAKVDEAAKHQQVTLDFYPYTAGSTRLEAIYKLGRFDDEYAHNVLLATVPGRPDLDGKTVAQAAAEMDLPYDQAIERILEGPGIQTVIVHFSMEEPDVEANAAHPLVMVGSDGIPVLEGKPHPRLYGTFPRMLGVYVRERGLATLEDAVRRMSALPCDTFGLTGRGYLREGAYADLVLFDPATVRDLATYQDPHRESTGITLVVVNGGIAFQDGRHTGVGSGRFLRFRAP